ncbi:gamma-aminobutyric acid receptor subunit alpha-6-like isoform X2 [Parasteatoda tepidariorum]|uniref:gamma-aminobutyric acid receptor subunit alpha-6-like isoform X2 n=1 Tax=Parasteatoda tepidariorum TaxID=114398 RepID=UPI00077FBA45|nr:gamma-aminobutyric acid receptor subunit alpha-6-like isoform X2 [Parasteatoda tepidariorum]
MKNSRGNVVLTAHGRSNPLMLLSSSTAYNLLMSINWLILSAFISFGQCNELSKLSNTTSLLDSLLSEDKYDRRIRPGFGGPAAIVETDINIRSFGPILESERVYSMDCYFRQTWYDSRLRFTAAQEELSLNWKFLQKVWIPDTFFFNGKNSYLHKVTVPNKFIRLRPDGQLLYSMRLTVKASCPMHLRKYPLDTQACPLEIGSYAYPSQDVKYIWKNVSLSEDVVLSQYEFVNISIISRTNTVRVGDREDQRTVLVVHFIIARRKGYFILQIYAPCAMIVGASWVSFWINRSDAAGRVAVGATTVLTIVTMGFGGRAREKVGSATAIDWFVIMCFTFVFAALVEYAFVNYIDNYEKQQIKKQLELDREKKKKEEATDSPTTSQPSSGFSSVRFKEPDEKTTNSFSRDKQLLEQQKQLEELMQGAKLSIRRRPFPLGRGLSLEKSPYRNRHIASKVDSYARVLFPVSFGILNLLYWTLFLHILDDELTAPTEGNANK